MISINVFEFNSFEKKSKLHIQESKVIGVPCIGHLSQYIVRLVAIILVSLRMVPLHLKVGDDRNAR